MRATFGRTVPRERSRGDSAAIVHPPVEDDELDQGHEERDREQTEGHDRAGADRSPGPCC